MKAPKNAIWVSAMFDPPFLQSVSISIERETYTSFELVESKHIDGAMTKDEDALHGLCSIGRGDHSWVRLIVVWMTHKALCVQKKKDRKEETRRWSMHKGLNGNQRFRRFKEHTSITAFTLHKLLSIPGRVTELRTAGAMSDP